MHSINPYLRAFFKSNLPAQCNPVNHHILLVPTTECLLTARDGEANALYADIASSEDFLASHVIRISNPQGPVEGSVRDSKGKAKQYNTINGRTLVIKESFVYSNKGIHKFTIVDTFAENHAGFKNLNQAQLLTDSVFHSDSLDSQQWLIYYISRPLVGLFEPIQITPAVFPNALDSLRSSNSKTEVPNNDDLQSASSHSKKEIRTFNDLLNNFPMIARQMQPGLEKVFKDFSKAMNDWVPSNQSRRSSIASHRSLGSTTLRSNGSVHSNMSNGRPKSPSIITMHIDEEEDHMRRALESSVTAAIDLFQKVDKQQLSFLGATTELTGPVVERLIERYIAEQLQESFLFPRLCNCHKLADIGLESKIHAMQYVDVAQVGVALGSGRQAKNKMAAQITKGADEFRKLGVAGSPQQMLEILLATQKLLTAQSPLSSLESPSKRTENAENTSFEKQPQMMNADTLVSLLLVVVIRSQVRHLHARLSYMRNFMFIEDVDAGETGYALSTFEAVLSYLSMDSAGLRKASRRNKSLWHATEKGQLDVVKKILESSNAPEAQNGSLTPSGCTDVVIDDPDVDEGSTGKRLARTRPDSFRPKSCSGVVDDSADAADAADVEGTSLAHVFPFQATPEARKAKRVTMDMRSLSNASEHSYLSRTTTADSQMTAIEGDTSVETLAQTQDIEGNSILMMAIEARQVKILEYLLSLEDFFPLGYVLEDANKGGTSLLSAAVQLNSHELTNILLQRIMEVQDERAITAYFTRCDDRGRTIAHYLFNAPWLLSRVGDIIAWTQRDKIGQTPLLALCRSYDHPEYYGMVHAALGWAGQQQGDAQPLRLDDHVDAKGNTLLHVVNEPSIANRLLQCCDSDPNATNDKRFTPLMMASKFGRMDMVRVLFADPRVDTLAREQRGMTAVELAKDDEIRNRIDDMELVSNAPMADGRVTAVVRSFFVEDASVRMIIKSATRSDNGMIGVTTCRRSLVDFENLAKWLALEHPASWLPSIFNFRSPFQLVSKPSRAALQDIQTRLDGFLKIMLSHSTFSTHELLWEFILFPEIQPDMMAERSRKKAQIRVENVREDYEPIDDVGDISSFVEHARESIRGVNHSTKSVVRRVNSIRVGFSSRLITSLPFRLLTWNRLRHCNELVRKVSRNTCVPANITHDGLQPLCDLCTTLCLRPTRALPSRNAINQRHHPRHSFLPRSPSLPHR